MIGKDIEKLIKLLRNLGNSISDAGTYEERQTKYLIVKWKYKGNTFAHKFPDSLKTTSLLEENRLHKAIAFLTGINMFAN